MTIRPLTVRIARKGRVCVLEISGELDIATSPILTQRATAALRPPTERLILDLSGLRFIDCCGARELAAVTRAAPAGCPVLVRGASRRVRRILDLLGLPLERRGAVSLDRSDWLVLEFQAVRSWVKETQADSQALAAQARQARSRRTATRGSTRSGAGTSRDLRPKGRDQWPYLPGGAAG